MHEKGFQARILTWIQVAVLSSAQGPCKRQENSEGGERAPLKGTRDRWHGFITLFRR